MDIREKLISEIKVYPHENTLRLIYNDQLQCEDVLQEEYHKWRERQTAKEDDLAMQIMMYESYFDDMCIEKDSIVGKYLVDRKISVECFMLEPNYYKFVIADTKNDSETDLCTRTLRIDPKAVNNKNIILHEMLHAHEHVLSLKNPIFKDIITLELYKHLKEKIPELDNIISAHAEFKHNIELTEIGGYHSILFLLKSLDLDLRCNNKLLTVFGYDYNRWLTDAKII